MRDLAIIAWPVSLSCPDGPGTWFTHLFVQRHRGQTLQAVHVDVALTVQRPGTSIVHLPSQPCIRGNSDIPARHRPVHAHIRTGAPSRRRPATSNGLEPLIPFGGKPRLYNYGVIVSRVCVGDSDVAEGDVRSGDGGLSVEK